MDPFLTYAENRELREKVWRNYYSRGDNGDAHDNNAIITEILSLRAQRAKLLGYPTHAHWRLDPQMAKVPEAAMDLMLRIWPKAVKRVAEEVADMQRVADEADDKITIEAWDYRYYAEKVRKAKYDLDFNEVKPYLQLDRLREAMMWASTQLYGLQYKRLTDLPVFHPDVEVWEVTGTNGEHIGVWYFDPYAREGKRSGAWMTDYRAQDKLDGPTTTIVSNNSNFVKGRVGEPVLISWDDAVTLFHEFGHALHGLLSNVTYPSQSGTNVARDYVEFPSQLNEHWLSTPEVLSKFAVHVETGKPLPKELLEKIDRAATFNEGFTTVEFLASALIDMKLHLAGDTPIDPDKFERETLESLAMPKQIVMRHRTPHFSHIFSGDDYSAGYYSYLWADALTADAAEAFKVAGSFYDKEVAKRLYEHVMSVGDTIDPAEGFRRFRGRDVDTDALLRKRGFPVE
jgi:peptidyl-dipeptidase Dcp